MIKLAKTSTTEIVEVFQIIGEKVMLLNDSKIRIAFAPLAKAISKELTDLKINNTYSYTDNVGYVTLHGSVSQLEEIEYKFNIKCGLVLIEKTTYSVQIEHTEEYHED